MQNGHKNEVEETAVVAAADDDKINAANWDESKWDDGKVWS